MYLRISSFHLKPDTSQAQAVSAFADVIRTARAQDGFLGCSLLMNEHTGIVAGFTYWDNQEHASQAGLVLQPLLYQTVRDITDAPCDIAGYEILDFPIPDGGAFGDDRSPAVAWESAAQ